MGVIIDGENANNMFSVATRKAVATSRCCVLSTLKVRFFVYSIVPDNHTSMALDKKYYSVVSSCVTPADTSTHYDAKSNKYTTVHRSTMAVFYFRTLIYCRAKTENVIHLAASAYFATLFGYLAYV